MHIPKCNQCDSAYINGVYCHETGCPNSAKVWNEEDKEWQYPEDEYSNEEEDWMEEDMDFDEREMEDARDSEHMNYYDNDSDFL